jgi:hypothetical protein
MAEPQAHCSYVEERMSRAELIFPALIFIVIVVFAGGGYFIGEYSWGVIVFPLGAASLACALCAIEIVRGLASQRIAAPVRAAAAAGGGEEQPPLWGPGAAWMFALPVFLYGLGFVAGPAVYLLACLRTNRFSWALSATIAAASVAMTFGLFIHVMGVQLPVMPLWWE